MNSGTQFEPYDRDYESGYRYHGKANYNAILSTFITQPQMGQTFGEDTFPYICYAYDSINNKIVHVGSVRWADEKLTITIAPVSNDGYIKHFLACTSDCPVSDLIGDTDRITNVRFNQNLQRYNPLDIDFQWTRFGLQAGVINTETLQKSVVNSIDELKALDSSKYVVEYTKCRNFYKDTRTNDWGGFVDYDNTVSLVNNCNDTVLYCRGKGTNNVRYGINVVPRFGIGANTQGQPTYANAEYNSADTGIEIIGLDWNEYNEVVIPTNNIFNYLDNGGVMQVTSAGSDYKNLDYRLTIEQTLKELAFTGLIFCHNDDPHSNLYAGYIDPDGLATGELIPYADWEKTDSLNVKNKFMTEFPDLHIKPKPTPDGDYPDDPWGKIEWGGAYLGAGNFTNLWYCTATDLENLRRWMNGADTSHPLPEGFDPMRQILGLMQFPIGLGGTLTEEFTMRTQANVTVHSGVMINRGFGDDLYYNLGSIDIPLRMKERGVPFLDYGSTVELYVPFCGVFQLDPQTVLGTDLSVEMWLSPVTGECNCIVSVGRGNNRGPVAFGSGNMAADIPVTANGYGLYAAAAKEASLKRSELMFGGLTQGVQSLSAGANTANTLAIGEQIVGESIAGAWGAAGAMVGGASAAIGLGVALAQATHNIRALDVGMQHVKNASGTSVSGSFSGTSAWHYPFQCYVKITRPRYRIPSNYAHTQGIPLIKAQSLSSCNGFTMCVGTDLSSVSATEIEKEQIAAFLSNGVIV